MPALNIVRKENGFDYVEEYCRDKYKVLSSEVDRMGIWRYYFDNGDSLYNEPRFKRIDRDQFLKLKKRFEDIRLKFALNAGSAYLDSEKNLAVLSDMLKYISKFNLPAKYALLVFTQRFITFEQQCEMFEGESFDLKKEYSHTEDPECYQIIKRKPTFY